MSYEQAMEAAGAKIVLSKWFGSYQGDWWALVDFRGVRGWVNGCYGSCSGCDSFQAEFGYCDLPDDEGRVCDRETYEMRPATPAELVEAQRRLSDFGMGYLEPLYSQAEAEAKAAENIEWDYEAAEMLAFIRTNAELAGATP